MAASWESHKDTLRTLYIDRGETLKDIMPCMRELHGFAMSKGQYERQFKKWGFRKYSKAERWADVSRKVAWRQRQGKRTVVRKDGEEVSQERLNKERRYASAMDLVQFVELPQTPEGFSVCTPRYDAAPRVSINNLPSLELFSLLRPSIDSANILFSLPNHDLVSRMVSEGIVRRAPALPQCVDWVHSLAGERHLNLDIVYGSTAFEIDIPSELSSVSRHGDHCRLLFSIIHSAANNLLSRSQASEMLPMVLQNNNRKVFHSLIAGQSPATKAIARTFLPLAIDSLEISLVSALLDTGISPDSYVFDSRQTPLQIAIHKKSTEMMQLLLNRGADVNMHIEAYYPHSADTYLKAAVMTGRLDLVQRLIRAGAHVNDTEPRRIPSALQYASRTGQIDIVQLLLVAGADVHVPRGFSEKTALQEAAGAGNIAVVQLLLSYGADVNAPSGKYGGTALELAARSGNVDITQLLLFHGATDAISALDTAGKYGRHHLVTHLIHSEMRLYPIADNAFGRTALRAAALCGETDLVRKLLACGVNTDAPPTTHSESGWITALQAAAYHGYIGLAQLLMNHGANINAPAVALCTLNSWPQFCPIGGTALQEAVRRNHMHLVPILLDHGADVNAPAATADERMPVLAAAVFWRNFDIFQLLLNRGADMKAQGASVVIEAVGHVSLEFVRFLLDTWTLATASSGNLGWTLSRDGQTALERAAECDDVELIRILLEHEAGDKSLALLEAVRGGSSMGVVELLLVSGAEVGCLDDDHEEDMTALQEAARDIQPDALRLLLEHRSHQTPAFEKSRALQMSALEGSLDAARLLLDHGADVNAVPSLLNGGDDGTKTALQAAAGKGDLKMVLFLLEAGADVESRVLSEDEEGTALQFAAIAGSMSVVTTLVQAGADVNAPLICRWGRTAIEGAAEHGRLDIVHLLLSLGVEASGSRAMQFARKEGHDGVVALLEKSS